MWAFTKTLHNMFTELLVHWWETCCLGNELKNLVDNRTKYVFITLKSVMDVMYSQHHISKQISSNSHSSKKILTKRFLNQPMAILSENITTRIKDCKISCQQRNVLNRAFKVFTTLPYQPKIFPFHEVWAFHHRSTHMTCQFAFLLMVVTVQSPLNTCLLIVNN